MDRILRSLFQVGGVPETNQALGNWHALTDYDLDYTNEEDKKIVEYLTLFYNALSAPPDFTLVKEYFENKDEIEVVTRLDELKKSQFYTHTNFKSLCRAERQRQVNRNVVLVCRDAQQIAEHGRDLEKPIDGKKKLRGAADALLYLQHKTRTMNVGDEPVQFDGPSTIASHKCEIRHLLRHFNLTSGRPNALVGYAGSSKTFLAVELALAVAAGKRSVWGGVPIDLEGEVVHLDYEMGRDYLYRRYQRVAHGMGIDLNNLRAIPRPENWRAAAGKGGVQNEDLLRIQHLKASIAAAFARAQGGVQNEDLLRLGSFPKINLCSPGAEAAFVKICRGKALLIIDSFRAATAGARVEENSSEMRTYLDMLGSVSDQTKCIILVLHHERKSGKDSDASTKLQTMRGSSGLADAFGATIHVEPTTNGWRVVQGKVSAGRSGDPVLFRLEDVGEGTEQDSEGLRIVAATEAEADSILENDIKSIVTAIEARDGYIPSNKDLRAVVKMRTDRLQDAIKMMRLRGTLTNDDKQGYRLAAVVQPEDLL